MSTICSTSHPGKLGYFMNPVTCGIFVTTPRDEQRFEVTRQRQRTEV